MSEKREEEPMPAKSEETEAQGTVSRHPELDELQREVERRLQDNRRFLENFMDDDFVDEEEPEQEDEFFEEL